MARSIQLGYNGIWSNGRPVRPSFQNDQEYFKRHADGDRAHVTDRFQVMSCYQVHNFSQPTSSAADEPIFMPR